MSEPAGGPIATARSIWHNPSRRNVLLTVGAGLLVQLMLVVTGPFLARLLGPSGRGDLAALMLWPIVLVQLGGLGIPAAMTYYISRGSSRHETIRRALSFAGVQALVLVTLQTLIVVFVFGDRGAEVRDGALLTIAAVPALLAQEYGLAVLQARSDMAGFNALRLLPTAIFMVAVIVLFITSAGLVAVTLSWVGATALVGSTTFTLAILRGRTPPVTARESGQGPTGRELLSFGLRGILSANSATDIIRPEQIALVLFLPSRALGLYVVALAITNLPYFVAKAIGLVAFPAVAREGDATTARRIAWRYLWIIVAVAGAIVGALLATAAVLIPLFFGDAFRDSVDLSYILLIGAMFTAVRRVGAECMRGRGQPGAGTTAEIVAILWLLAGLAVLLPTVGLTGVAIALASSQVASLVLLVVIATRRDELHRSDATATLRSGISEVAPALARYRR